MRVMADAQHRRRDLVNVPIVSPICVVMVSRRARDE
jgi:hypothetical protein